jgi:hypothetical protein
MTMTELEAFIGRIREFNDNCRAVRSQAVDLEAHRAQLEASGRKLMHVASVRKMLARIRVEYRAGEGEAPVAPVQGIANLTVNDEGHVVEMPGIPAALKRA